MSPLKAVTVSLQTEWIKLPSSLKREMTLSHVWVVFPQVTGAQQMWQLTDTHAVTVSGTQKYNTKHHVYAPFTTNVQRWHLHLSENTTCSTLPHTNPKEWKITNVISKIANRWRVNGDVCLKSTWNSIRTSLFFQVIGYSTIKNAVCIFTVSIFMYNLKYIKQKRQTFF